MRYKLGIIVLGLILTTGVGVARAENNPCRGGDCSGQQGSCREVGDGGYCDDSDLSPSFDKSPVDHSFNPTICVMPGSCSFQGGQPS
jgi:hypothetical protein